MVVSVVEKVWNKVQSLVKLRLMLLSWSFESGSAEEVVVNVLKGIRRDFPERMWAA